MTNENFIVKKTEAPIKEMKIITYYQMGTLENISNNVKKLKNPDSISSKHSTSKSVTFPKITLMTFCYHFLPAKYNTLNVHQCLNKILLRIFQNTQFL